jgi:hypothetical protein
MPEKGTDVCSLTIATGAVVRDLLPALVCLHFFWFDQDARALHLTCMFLLLQTALGIMSTFAVGETSAIDETTNACVKIYMNDAQAHAQ